MLIFFADFTTKWTSCRSNFFHVLPSPININWISDEGLVRFEEPKKFGEGARKSVASALTSFVIFSTLSPPFGGMPQAASLNVLSASPTFYFTMLIKTQKCRVLLDSFLCLSIIGIFTYLHYVTIVIKYSHNKEKRQIDKAEAQSTGREVAPTGEREPGACGARRGGERGEPEGRDEEGGKHMYCIVENHFECDGWNGNRFSLTMKKDGTWHHHVPDEETMFFETKKDAIKHLRTLKKPREDSEMFVMKATWLP